jgi:hypothetical protein
MIEFSDHPILYTLGLVMVIQLVITLVRGYIVNKQLEKNARELEATLQESEERIRDMMLNFEENRRRIIETMQTINSITEQATPPAAKNAPNEPPQS